MTAIEAINKLFEELVPAEGPAETVAGEIIRATCRIGYRYWNDGDQLGIGYGKETVNPAARYLMEKGSDGMNKILRDMWGLYSEELYERAMRILQEEVQTYIERIPELKTLKNEEDFWDYRNEDEDVDDYDEEEEDW